MYSTRWMSRLAGLMVMSAVAATVCAQRPRLNAPKPDPTTQNIMGGMDFKTSVGSFKLLGAGEVPARGKLTFKFNGTVLISGLEKGSTITTSGAVLKELTDEKHNKSVYHGNGTIVMDGRVKAIQFFGRDLTGRFYGRGIFRLYGEFDKNLDTGTYKLDGDGDIRPWGTGGMTIVVPSIAQATPKPTVKIVPKGG